MTLKILCPESFSLRKINNKVTGKSWLEKWLDSPSLDTAGDFQQINSDRSLCEKRTYIERDVRQIAEIEDVTNFNRFFRICGALTAQEVNYSQLGRDIWITPQTAGGWLSILSATFQWFELQPSFGNTVKRISRKPMGYMGDTGMICATQVISSPEAITWSSSLGGNL